MVISLGIGALIGSAIAAGASLYNAYKSEKNNNKNIEMQEKQLAYTDEANKNQQQWSVADAQKAGLNPLAMNNGGMQAPTWQNTDNTAGNVDLANATSLIGTAIEAKLQEKRMEVDERMQEKQLENERQMQEAQFAHENKRWIKEQYAAFITKNRERRWQKEDLEYGRETQKQLEDIRQKAESDRAKLERELKEKIAKNEITQREAQQLREVNLKIDELNEQITRDYYNDRQFTTEKWQNLRTKAWQIYAQANGVTGGGTTLGMGELADWGVNKLGDLLDRLTGAAPGTTRVPPKLDLNAFNRWFEQTFPKPVFERNLTKYQHKEKSYSWE